MIDIKYSLPIGAKLKSQNEYTITSAIGQGGFGITYIATADVKIGNITATARFAVKEFFLNEKCKRADDGVTLIPLDDSFAEEIKSSLKDFITEGERINKLCRADEHIVNVNEVFSANNTAYFVMEYIDGGNLVDLVHQKGKLNEEEAKEIIIPIANAIGKLHEEHVLHLDIKPENIMMRKNDAGKLFPVIIDFGISMHFNKQGKATTRSKNGAVSIGYSPVEQYGQVTSFAPKVDIYALGATMFYMLTGNNPQQAFDVTKDYIEHSLTDTDETVKKAVMHSMAKDNTLRTTSVQEFIEDLSETTTKPTVNPHGKEPTHTVKLSESGNNTMFFTGKTFKIICGIAAACILVVVGAMFIPQNSPSPRNNDNNEVTEAVTSDHIENGHEWVDLGLSVKWATCNVGANTPKESGDYYAWGETEVKKLYTWDTYFDTKDQAKTFFKYDISKKTVLDPEDDIAHVSWGGSWRMPTIKEFDELIAKCSWKRVYQHNVCGMKITSKINGNSIFLPGAGYRDEAEKRGNNYGSYWSSSLDTKEGYSYLAHYLFIDSSGSMDDNYTTLRYMGFTVRPVCP